MLEVVGLILCSCEETCLSLAFLSMSWCFTDFCCSDGGDEGKILLKLPAE